MWNETLLSNEERAVYRLRELYRRYGYRPYRMSKFEEYDLYGKNKDFLISDGIITFTDTSGKLLALKPDVTLSIIKNSKDSDGVQKVYYDENVYRISQSSHNFKEILQTGLECIGRIGLYEVCEVLSLAVQSLQAIDERCVLALSHAGLISALFEENGVDSTVQGAILRCIERKNEDELAKLDVTDTVLSLGKALIADYADYRDAIAALAPFATGEAKAALEELRNVFDTMTKLGYADAVRVDFSLINDRRYYSGVVFKGYIDTVPTSVLSGGQYDRLMHKMGRQNGAIGFAVYLDSLERLHPLSAEPDVDVLLMKAADAEPATVLEAVTKLTADGYTVLVADEIPAAVTYRKAMKLETGRQVTEL